MSWGSPIIVHPCHFCNGHRIGSPVHKECNRHVPQQCHQPCSTHAKCDHKRLDLPSNVCTPAHRMTGVNFAPRRREKGFDFVSCRVGMKEIPITCYNCRNPGHKEKQCPNKIGEIDVNKQLPLGESVKISCFYCKNLGHKQFQCPYLNGEIDESVRTAKDCKRDETVSKAGNSSEEKEQSSISNSEDFEKVELQIDSQSGESEVEDKTVAKFHDSNENQKYEPTVSTSDESKTVEDEALSQSCEAKEIESNSVSKSIEGKETSESGSKSDESDNIREQLISKSEDFDNVREEQRVLNLVESQEKDKQSFSESDEPKQVHIPIIEAQEDPRISTSDQFEDSLKLLLDIPRFRRMELQVTELIKGCTMLKPVDRNVNRAE